METPMLTQFPIGFEPDTREYGKTRVHDMVRVDLKRVKYNLKHFEFERIGRHEKINGHLTLQETISESIRIGDSQNPRYAIYRSAGSGRGVCIDFLEKKYTIETLNIDVLKAHPVYRTCSVYEEQGRCFHYEDDGYWCEVTH